MKKIFWKSISLLLLFAMLAGLLAGCTQSDIDTAISTISEVADILLEDEPSEQPSAVPKEDPSTEPKEIKPVTEDEPVEEIPEGLTVAEDGIYTSRDEVALYIHTYGHLPSNFISKTKARNNGWNGGALTGKNEGKCIGGSVFENREGKLPDAEGRRWTECDINTLGAKSRGVERIVFSNDGLIYYSPDHYETFILLYGDPDK